MTKSLLIVGAGPAGLSAAINAASEGLQVTVLDRANHLGGQFQESNDIENFPGVPMTDGATLAGRMIAQAHQFGVEFCCPVSAAHLERKNDRLVVTSDAYDEHSADAVIIALGLQYRRLDAPGVADLMGAGVYYGAPPVIAADNSAVAILGGGNSAGQEAVKLASNPDRKVYLIVRSPLASKMSDSLVNQVRARANIEVIEGAEIASADGGEWHSLHRITLSTGRVLEVSSLLVYIGATPHTYWLSDTLALDANKFITASPTTGFQTSMPGVFAIGDARSGSTKRIAAAVGEGSSVMPFVHSYLSTLETSK